MNVAIQLLTLLAQIVGDLSSVSSIANVITTLEQIIAAGIEEIETVAPMIKNIIAALQSNSAITADQMTQLQSLDAQTDDAFEAAAAAAGAAPRSYRAGGDVYDVVELIGRLFRRRCLIAQYRDRRSCRHNWGSWEMPGKLDEISRAIGSLETSVRELQRRMDENCELQTRRHADNSAALRDLAAKLDLHAVSVEMIRPTVAALELSRSKLATWASIGFAVAVFAGWVVEAVIKWTVGRVLAHFQ